MLRAMTPIGKSQLLVCGATATTYFLNSGGKLPVIFHPIHLNINEYSGRMTNE